MPTVYQVQPICEPADGRRDALEGAITEDIRGLGLQGLIKVDFVTDVSNDAPNIALFFGGPDALASSACSEAARQAQRVGRVVVPIVNAAEKPEAALPHFLSGLNALFWGADGATKVARVVLEELGIEERQRRVFISHKRQDALLMAEQLHDELSHHHFRPFIDRFVIDPGEDVQARIADALEDFAFLLLVESPLASESEWVFYETNYALSHYMGLSILTWPGAAELPGTRGLPRLSVSEDELFEERSHMLLTPEALARVVAAVEEGHARSLVRRRQNLLVSVQEAITAAGKEYIPLTQWRLLVPNEPSTIVGVEPRLPEVEDIFRLDQLATSVSGPESRSLLIHAARHLSSSRQEVLQWAAGGRSITLLPENAVGAYW